MTMTAVDVDDGEARVRFEAFDVDAYALFLRCKRLPESHIAYDWRSDSYTVTTSARFLPLLTGLPAPATRRLGKLAAHLFDCIGSTAWVALEQRRRVVGFELKESYHRLAQRNARRALASERFSDQLDLLAAGASATSSSPAITARGRH
jgi:hypothetical protein